MGTICAPSYANIFMDKFEKQYIYPFTKSKSILYRRYIDDIFMIWTGTKQELETFLHNLNTKHRTIKFDYEINENKIAFLDTIVYKDSDNNLQTTLYKKPTDRRIYLHNKSEHPYSLKKSIPYSQALRIKRICSTKEEFSKECNTLKEKLLERGYDQNLIENQINKVDAFDRNQLLTKKKKATLNRIPISLTYNRTLPNIKSILQKNWNILQINPSLQTVFENHPVIAYRKNRNLKQIIGGNFLSESKLLKNVRTNTQGECKPCLQRKTLCCKQVMKTKEFKSHINNRVFKIFHKVNCKSRNVIYLMECIKCKIQYVGKAETPLNLRINNHRKDVANPNAIPVCKHFAQPAHKFNDHAKFTIIEQLKDQDISKETITTRLKERENFWIKTLETLTPKGLNQELN